MDASFAEPQWIDSDAHARTYLWSLNLPATPFFYDPNPSLSGPSEFDDWYSAPPSPTHPTFLELMKESVMEDSTTAKPEIVIQPNTPLTNAFDPSSPFSSSTASSSSNSALPAPLGLPSSPRNPVPRRSTISHGPNGAPNNLLSPPRAISKSRSVPNFSGITKHPRSAGRRKYSVDIPSDIPPVPHIGSRTSSPTPSIILTSPESPRGSTSSMSLFSSSYDDSETSYSSSSSDRESVASGRRPPALPGVSSLHEARLLKLAQTYREEPLVPDALIPNHIVREVFDSQSNLEVLTLDASEYLPHPFSRLKPGTHGLVVPCAWSLIDILALHADLHLGDIHLFLSNGHARDQRYLGLYRIVLDTTAELLSQEEWAAVPMRIRHAVARVFRTDAHGRITEKQVVENLRKLNSGEERLYPVLFQFIKYDWELFNEMAERMDREELGLPKERHPEVHKHSPNKLIKKRKPGRGPRIVTVDGMVFEMLTPAEM